MAQYEFEIKESLPETSVMQAKTSAHGSTSLKEAIGGEHYVPASVGSPGRQDLLTHTVDIDNDGETVGYIGKISEISWLARAQAYLLPVVDPGCGGSGRPVDQDATTQLTYFMDEEDILSVDEDYVDALHWPGALHAFSREQCLEELHAFAQHHGSLSWDQRKWLALANLIWAMGSRWLHRSMLDDIAGLENHLMYYARSRALGLDHRVTLDALDIHGVKRQALLCLYLYTNGSVTR
ncbi:hypothetical protein LTR10_024292 [Elasticomyces elasticus]|nr:hypothetical protein LTR10_024292 [Elasticomyces elasticus]KAK5024813.1 hypothetical protein LTR13_010782 [Exophiala sideris]